MRNHQPIVVSVLTILLGSGWLLNTLSVIPNVNWVWTIGLAHLGLLTLLVGGINKVTFVLGVWLMSASMFSILRQTGRMKLDIEVPCLVIVLGLLMLISQLTPLPLPAWLKEDPSSKKQG